MKVSADRLSQQLARGLAPLYTVYGDELLLALEAADAIRAQALQAGFSERELFTVDGGFNWRTLKISGDSPSLFAAQRLLEIRIPSGKPGVEGGRALEAYCAALPPDTLTLVMLPKLDRQTQKSKWFQALDTTGVSVAATPVERSRLPRWIEQRLADQRQSAAPHTVRFLADRVEGNLLAAHQEIQKLGLLYPPGELSFEQVKDAVLDVSRYDVFKLTDAVLQGETARVVKILDGLNSEGADPILVLWALSREIRSLANIHFAVAGGTPLAQALRAEGVWESRHTLTRQALQRLSPAALAAALRHAAEIDRTIKGLARGDAWDMLLHLALALAQGKVDKTAWTV
ncbi:MAG TPA: DNA polymerase III subunit delta [Betaproteobacteria bacterium]|nr:DNA polymerase III subunit delta [Betaproteobacteria bacterium]